MAEALFPRVAGNSAAIAGCVCQHETGSLLECGHAQLGMALFPIAALRERWLRLPVVVQSGHQIDGPGGFRSQKQSMRPASLSRGAWVCPERTEGRSWTSGAMAASQLSGREDRGLVGTESRASVARSCTRCRRARRSSFDGVP